MVLSVVEAVPADSKPPAADVDERISTDERHGFGASAPSSTRVPSLYIGRAGDSTFLPKLVEIVGPSSARAEDISPWLFIIYSTVLCALANLLVGFHVFLCGETWLLS